MHFTQEQQQYLEGVGFEKLRDSKAYWMNVDNIGHIFVECLVDSYRVEIETINGVDSVVEGDNLKKVVRSALRRYKYKSQDIIKMREHIDELYPKTEGIPK